MKKAFLLILISLTPFSQEVSVFADENPNFRYNLRKNLFSILKLIEL